MVTVWILKILIMISKENSDKVYIVTLNYNGYNYTNELLHSLYNLSYPNVSIIVVDDYSSDNSVELLKINHPNIDLICNQKNLNYCRSFNVGIRKALNQGADYVFIINNDTKDFSTNYFEEILSTFKSDLLIGMVGSKCYDYNEGVRRDESSSLRFGVNMDTPTEGYVISKETFAKIGLFNEQLRIYFEDLDFIVRMRKAGLKTAINTNISFKHYGGGTTSKIIFMSNYMRIRNLILFTRKYGKNLATSYILKELKGNLGVHVYRFTNAVRKLQLSKALKLALAIKLGILSGIFIPLSLVWTNNRQP